MANKKNITTRAEDYSQWYLDVIEAAELAQNSAVRGSMVIRPNGYALWEGIQAFLDKRIKETGHRNAYFPLLIPKSFLSKEASHVKGFAKEAAVVTHYRLIESEDGNSVVVDPAAKLEEELIIRPTSETIIYSSFSDWVTSWRDLPLLINQWGNVLRWELRTRPFLRTAEFLWQEGHCAHATHEESVEEVVRMLDVYYETLTELLAIPAVKGRKSASERFAGAIDTYTLESLMPDGKALQSCTSHDLGQNFAQAFDVKFAAKDGTTEYVWQNSWGLSTRTIGALIMTHSDDKGLVLPPRIASTQVVIVPIFRDENKDAVLSYATDLYTQIKAQGIRVSLDDRDYETPGSKFNQYEKEGIPVRIEVGPRDMEAGQAVVAFRDNGEKQTISSEQIASMLPKTLEEIQQRMYEKAAKFLTENTHEINTFEEFKQQLEGSKGFLKAFWCEDEQCEEQIKAETKASTRCLPLDSKEEQGKCVHCGKDAKHRWIFAQSY